jgi:SAM-dependent methyltransferase
MPERIQILRAGIEPGTQKGLEIGALNAPTIFRHEGDVRYVDRASEAILREPYPDRQEGIVTVDYIWPGTGSLANVIGTGELFDWVIASHVIEHVPNMLGWLRGIAEVLKPNGVLNLAIPDCRFTFDIGTPRSTLGEVIESDLLGYTHPSIRQVFDYCFHAKAIQPGAIWEKEIDVAPIPPFAGEVAPHLAYAHAINIRDNGSYIDAHCWIVTPLSYINILHDLVIMGIMPSLIPTILIPTRKGDCEFFSSFRKTGQVIDTNLLKQKQLSILGKMRRDLENEIWHDRLIAGL